MPGARRGLVAPQNTFLESIIRRSSGQHSSFLLSNARIVDYPIVYCNDGFCKLSGFSRAEVMQKSSTCSFMYGELTDKETLKTVGLAFENVVQEQVEILLYKKNKTPLWLLLHIAPIRNEKDQVVLLLCTFKDITALKQPIDDDGGNGLSKFARLARSVTRNRSTLLQFSSHIPTTKYDNSRPSQIANMVNLSADVLPQYRQEAPKTPPHIILHYCLFKAIWDWVILILTFYTAVMVPYNVAFQSKTLDQVPLLVIDSIVDVVFFIDIVLNFHTTFVGVTGEVISDPKIIRMNYLKSWFVIDLLSCLPYDVFNAFQYIENSISTLFSALKVVRLLRLGRVVRKLDHYLEYGAAVLVLLILVFLLFAHWFACVWYSIGNDDLRNGIEFGWMVTLSRLTGETFNKTKNDVLQGGPSKEMRYVTALYYTLSCMTSVGFGNVAANTMAEKAFSIFMMICGSLLYATIFSNVTTIFQQFYASTARYHEMLNSVREFMKIHDVPKPLSERVMDYIVSSWAITKGIDATKILGEVLNYCPKDMKADICVHLNRKVFCEHPAFRLASDGCLRALAMHYTMTHSAPGDLIFHQGESLDSLCFVVSGSLEVIQDDEVVAILSKSDVFGDNFWKEMGIGQSAANVRALTYCDLHIIKRNRLLEVLAFYHAFANSFARNLTLTYNLRHRLIFRKVADVKKERELAEKRKNDPPLDLSSDHPVRKLISRFRKISDTRAIHASVDPERDSQVNPSIRDGDRPGSGTRVIVVSESTPQVNTASGLGGGAAERGKLDDDKTSDSSSQKSSDNSQVKGGWRSKEGAKLTEGPRAPLKSLSKWGRVIAKQQEPISESPEDEVKSNLQKSDSTDSGILKSNIKLDQIGEDQSGGMGAEKAEKENKEELTAVEHQMLTSLYNIRLEIKEEMECINLKISRIDEQIGQILRLFTPSSSPCSSRLSSYPCSKFGSPNNTTATNSAEHSPKNMLSPSSHWTSLDNVHRSAGEQSLNIEVQKRPMSPVRNESLESNTSNSSGEQGTPSEPCTKPPNGSVSNGGGKKMKSKSVKGRSEEKVKETNFGGGKVTCNDDDDVPFKDKDLDIL